MSIRNLFLFTILFNLGHATEVEVTDRVIGKTPTILGINTGDMPQGSAFPEWVRALGVNGARLRLNVDPERSEDPKISSATDLARKAKELEQEVTETQAAQIELDKTAEEFKRLHAERH
jgi:hypothetical protein